MVQCLVVEPTTTTSSPTSSPSSSPPPPSSQTSSAPTPTPSSSSPTPRSARPPRFASSPSTASAAAPLAASHLHYPDPVASNLALKSIVRRSHPRDAIAFFCRVANPVGCRPSRCTFQLLVTAAKLCDSIDYGELFHYFALKLGFLSHLSIPNSLIHVYAPYSFLDLARQMFDEMPERDRVSYNSLLDGYVKSGGFDEAEQL